MGTLRGHSALVCVLVSSHFVLLFTGRALADDLDMVLQHIAQAKQRVQAARFSVEFTRTPSPTLSMPQAIAAAVKPTPSAGITRVVQKGLSRRWLSTNQSLGPDGSVLGTLEHQTVLNQEYSFVWAKGDPFAFQWMHDSPAKLVHEADLKVRVAARVPELLATAFGDGIEDLPAMHDRIPDSNQWKIRDEQDPDGGLIYVIELSRAGEPWSTYKVSPRKGFTVSEAVIYLRGGKVAERINLVSGEVSPGIWLPETVDVRGEGQRASSRMSIKDLEVNGAIEDSEFELTALGLPDGLDLMQTSKDGLKTHLVHFAGRLMPASIWGEILLERSRAARVPRGLLASPLPTTQTTESADSGSSENSSRLDHPELNANSTQTPASGAPRGAFGVTRVFLALFSAGFVLLAVGAVGWLRTRVKRSH